jgi:hypothetical protein
MQIAVEIVRKKATCGFMDNARQGVVHNSTGAASVKI